MVMHLIELHVTIFVGDLWQVNNVFLFIFLFIEDQAYEKLTSICPIAAPATKACCMASTLVS